LHLEIGSGVEAMDRSALARRSGRHATFFFIAFAELDLASTKEAGIIEDDSRICIDGSVDARPAGRTNDESQVKHGVPCGVGVT
jgi:hypothetical protein